LYKFREEAANFSSLSVFYRNHGDSDLAHFEVADSPLWRLLLYPENASTSPKEEVIQKLMQLTGLQNTGKVISRLVDRLISINDCGTLKVLEVAFKGFLTGDTKSQATIHANVKEILEGLLEGSDGGADILRDILSGDRYQADTAEKHSSYSYEQVCQEFNNDIRALQLVLQNAVLPAVSIDKAFSARETKFIEDIIGILDGVNDDRFMRFVARNAEIIKASEFGKMKAEEAQRALDTAVMNEIQGILSELVPVQSNA